jgi:pilus assembly protein CpaB
MKNKIVLFVSIVFGLLAAILTRTYLSAKNDEFRELKERFNRLHGTLEVLCYKKDVPSGTVLSREVLGRKTVPAAGLRGQALTQANLSDVLGRKIVTGHRIGEILFWADVEGGNPVAGGLAADIRKRMRAVSINASGAAAVSGMVRPNDHVDVIGTFTFPRTAADGKTVVQELVTCTILQNVLVLATGRDTAKSLARPAFAAAGSYSTVTLEVTPREAEMLVFAEQIKGRLSLTLRNRNDTSYEKELPQVDFDKIRNEINALNLKRQADMGGRR